MWLLGFLLMISCPCLIKTLVPFDPWLFVDGTCAASMETCTFELQVTSTMTMFYKQLFRVVATSDGILHKYDNPNQTFAPSDILTGDGYPKLVYIFNDSLPGPVLHVYQGQKIYVRIYNNLPTETLSVHFHGIRQFGTPSSDGVGRVTQLSILPGSTFQHRFIAIDEGTFWYHSHVSSQTSMGLLGAFITHPKVAPTYKIKEFVLMLQDWQHFYTGEQHQLLVESGQFYPNSVESLMSSNTIDYLEVVDGSRAAQAFISSILINGRGQYFDPRNNDSSNTPLERLILYDSDSQYRIRLINGGSAFALVFSIDEHLLQVISSDGVPFNQSILVDQIVIGLGERYDVIINVTATSSRTSWWIRVNTLDKNNNPRWHGRAILQLGNDNVTSPMSSARNCSSQEPCRILNCPFTQYGSDSSSLICLTMQNMTTHMAYLDMNLLSDTTNVTVRRSLSLTMVMATAQQTGYESINYIGMLFPSLDKPILYIPQAAREKLPCSNMTDTMPMPMPMPMSMPMPMPMTMTTTMATMTMMMGQKCYNNIVVQYDDIIEFLVVNHDFDQHPMHLHGFAFHVIEQGLAQLNKTTGQFIANNPNVVCDDEHIHCACINCTVNTRLVKDTVQLPKGGYVRIRFRANNPGIWLFHCHTESHLDRGMALMIHVAEDRLQQQLQSASSAKKCCIEIVLLISTIFILATLWQRYSI